MADRINFQRKRGGRVVRVEEDSSAAERMKADTEVWKQLDGQAETVEEAARPDVEPGDLPQPEPEAPTQASTKAEWVDYAVDQGADRDEAEQATKAELVEQYG